MSKRDRRAFYNPELNRKDEPVHKLETGNAEEDGYSVLSRANPPQDRTYRDKQGAANHLREQRAGDYCWPCD